MKLSPGWVEGLHWSTVLSSPHCHLTQAPSDESPNQDRGHWVLISPHPTSRAPLCYPVFVKTSGPVHRTQVERCLGKVRYVSSVFSWPDSQMSTTEAASPLYSLLATFPASVLQLEVKCTCYLPNAVLSCFSRNMLHSGLDLIVPELIPTWCWWQSDSVGLNCL